MFVTSQKMDCDIMVNQDKVNLGDKKTEFKVGYLEDEI